MAGSIGVWLSAGMGAHDLARHAASQLLARPQVTLDREPGGRPFILDAPGLHLAISHTRDYAAVALSHAGPVGVDIEPIREVPAAALARHWFSELEADWVAGHPEDFLALWTQKEAVGKALGIGLRQGGLRRLMPLPPSAALTPVPGLPDIAVTSWDRPDVVVGLACQAPDAIGLVVNVIVVR